MEQWIIICIYLILLLCLVIYYVREKITSQKDIIRILNEKISLQDEIIKKGEEIMRNDNKIIALLKREINEKVKN